MSIQINVDNIIVVSALNNKMSNNRSLFDTVKKIWLFCINRNIWIVASYKKPKDNLVANLEKTLSRAFVIRCIKI